MKKIFYLLTTAICFSTSLKAQDDLSALFANEKKSSDPVTATFKTTRLNMGHSVELVGAHNLDFRISHNFGAMGSTYGGSIHNLYGSQTIANLRIAFEYGVNKRMNIGFGRSKGAGAVGELYDGYIKYKLLRQTQNNKMPVTVTLLGTSAISAMKASTDPTSETSFSTFSQRLSYAAQALVARKFSDKLSLQIMPTYVWRNYVAYDDENGFFAMGISGRYKFTKRSALIVDYFMPFSQYRSNLHKADKYYNPLGIGYEIETGGHVFHMSLVNTAGLIEQDFITNSSSSFTKWGFRLGFNISRWFVLY